jgi:tRNA-splicing ligase RtcB
VKAQKGKKKNSASSVMINKTLVQMWSPEAAKDTELIRHIRKVTRYPGIFPRIAIMPDYHLGGLSMNGSILASENMLYINAIGGDIGCGIASLKLPLNIDDIAAELQKIYHDMYSNIPTGRRINVVFEESIDQMELFRFESSVFNKANKKRAKQQLGTVGDGNHFVELQKDDKGALYLMVHSGSRMLGQVVRQAHIHNSSQPETSGAIEAESAEGRAYLADADFAVRYAKENRHELLMRAIGAINMTVPASKQIDGKSLEEEVIDTPHNHMTQETHFGKRLYVHRKGAVHVPKGHLGIIAGNMGDTSYIVRGTGNRKSFESCSHGAGRSKTRGEAFSKISMKAYLESVEGVVCRRDQSILDEAPGAYKNIERVMSYQRDLVKRVTALNPVVNVKG